MIVPRKVVLVIMLMSLIFSSYVALFVYSFRETLLGVVGHGRVFQVHAIGPLIGEDYVALSVRNTYGLDNKSEVILDCASDVKESLFKEIKSLSVNRDGFVLSFNNHGFCYSEPEEQIELGGVIVHLVF